MRAIAATVFSGVVNTVPIVVRDVSAIGGAGLIAYGAWLAYPPAGYVVVGLVLLAASILGARRAD